MGSGREPLRDLVEEAYILFAGRKPTDHGCCKHCCMEPEIEARFLSWEPRDIPVQDLRDWYFAASEIPFPRETMRWVLPRIFDLLADGADIAAVGHEVVLMRLAAAGFPSEWTDAEVDLVNRYVTELIVVIARGEIGSGDDYIASLDETLCMAGLGGVDLAPVIAGLDALPDEVLVAAFVRDGFTYGVPADAFWESGPAKDIVMGWYGSEAMLQRMMAFGTGDAGTPATRDDALRIAESILRWREEMGLA